MAQIREAERRDNFLDHGPNFFKSRVTKSSDRDVQKRIATDADPYGHVGTGRPQAASRARDYDFSTPNNDGPVDHSLPVEIPLTYSSGDPLAEAYRMISEHRGVRFGAQRTDGSWEVYAPSEVLAPTGEEQPKPGELPEATKLVLANALQSYFGKLSK